MGHGCSHSAWALSQPPAPRPHRGIMQSPAPLDLPRGWLPGFQDPARRCVVDDDDVMTASCLLGLQQKAGRTPLSPQTGLEGFFPYRVHRRQDAGGPAAAMPTPLPTDASQEQVDILRAQQTRVFPAPVRTRGSEGRQPSLQGMLRSRETGELHLCSDALPALCSSTSQPPGPSPPAA